MALLKTFKPEESNGKTYVIAYQSSKGDNYYISSPSYNKVKQALQVRPINGRLDKELVNVPVIIKHWKKNDMLKSKVLYRWVNKKQQWEIDE